MNVHLHYIHSRPFISSMFSVKAPWIPRSGPGPSVEDRGAPAWSEGQIAV